MANRRKQIFIEYSQLSIDSSNVLAILSLFVSGWSRAVLSCPVLTWSFADYKAKVTKPWFCHLLALSLLVLIFWYLSQCGQRRKPNGFLSMFESLYPIDSIATKYPTRSFDNSQSWRQDRCSLHTLAIFSQLLRVRKKYICYQLT